MRMVQSNMSQYQGQFWYVSRKKVEMKKPLYLSLGVERKYLYLMVGYLQGRKGRNH
jgi:hypothetical protein